MAEDSNLPYATPESKHLTLSKVFPKMGLHKRFFKKQLFVDAWEERRNNSREHFINTLPSFYGNKETVNLAIDFF